MLRPGQLLPAEVALMAAAVTSLRAEPATLSIRTGDRIALRDHVRILAVDSSGTVLGELGFYDWNYEGSALRTLSDGRVYGRSPGRVSFTVTFPAQSWPVAAASAKPTLTIPITVADTVVTSAVIAPAARP
jgi:hypothetical protein